MRGKNPFKTLSKFEWVLWIFSLFTVTLSFVIPSERDLLTLTASLIGVSALIFVAKGQVFGQILTVVFSVFYGLISFYFSYYGEMITYLAMTTPAALMSVFEWLRHPYGESSEVEIKRISKKEVLMLGISSVAVTVVFYFILRSLNTANLLISTVSVTTSFLASALTYMRSPYYAIAYAANDIILIILWVLASFSSISYIPMVACFVIFFINDVYGFINWSRMKKRQSNEKN